MKIKLIKKSDLDLRISNLENDIEYFKETGEMSPNLAQEITKDIVEKNKIPEFAENWVENKLESGDYPQEWNKTINKWILNYSLLKLEQKKKPLNIKEVNEKEYEKIITKHIMQGRDFPQFAIDWIKNKLNSGNYPKEWEQGITKYIIENGFPTEWGEDWAKNKLESGNYPPKWEEIINDRIIKRGFPPSFAEDWAKTKLNSGNYPKEWEEAINKYFMDFGYPLDWAIDWTKNKLDSGNYPQKWEQAINQYFMAFGNPPLFAEDWFKNKLKSGDYPKEWEQGINKFIGKYGRPPEWAKDWREKQNKSTQANNKMKIKLSKSQWQQIGKHTGWLKIAQIKELEKLEKTEYGYYQQSDQYQLYINELTSLIKCINEIQKNIQEYINKPHKHSELITYMAIKKLDPFNTREIIDKGLKNSKEAIPLMEKDLQQAQQRIKEILEIIKSPSFQKDNNNELLNIILSINQNEMDFLDIEQNQKIWNLIFSPKQLQKLKELTDKKISKEEDLFNEEYEEEQEKGFPHNFSETDFISNFESNLEFHNRITSFIQKYKHLIPKTKELIAQISKEENIKNIFRKLISELHPDKHQENKQQYTIATQELMSLIPKQIRAFALKWYKLNSK